MLQSNLALGEKLSAALINTLDKQSKKMRPAQSQFATQEEWIQSLANWTDEVPSDDNKKMFMVFTEKVAAENFLFDGEMWHFQDSFFNANEWAEIVAWATDEGNILIIEGTDEYDAAIELLDFAEIDAPDDEAIGGKKVSGTGAGESKDSWLNS